jgi:enamine deaminase RidA (YjgF/YER057c/UK114 family)
MTVLETDVNALTPEDRLARLGLELPMAPSPVAIYVPAVRTGNLVYSSGQLPLVNGAIEHPGKVGHEVTLEQAQAAAEQCTLNALAALKAQLGRLDAVKRVVKVVGFVASGADFTGQPAVVNGASQLLADAFGQEKGAHARSAVGVAALPLNASVEVEIIVEVETTVS